MRAISAQTLVIGASGYVGRALTELLPAAGTVVTGTSRRAGADRIIAEGSDLDRLLARCHFDQVVLTAQLTSPDMDWLLDRVDGPRWVVLSSAQLASRVPAPATEFALAREELALARGATVLRPTMIFGRGGDSNISRMVRAQRRWRVALQVGNGHQQVQPVHVADLVSLVARHCARPRAGLFGVGGDEPVPTRELLQMVKEVMALRLPVVRLSPSWLRLAWRVGIPGLRGDQLRRLEEDKTVDIIGTCAAFSWKPEPLGQRVEQAVWEVTGGR